MNITDLKGTVELANGYPLPNLGLGTFKMTISPHNLAGQHHL